MEFHGGPPGWPSTGRGPTCNIRPVELTDPKEKSQDVGGAVVHRSRKKGSPKPWGSKKPEVVCITLGLTLISLIMDLHICHMPISTSLGDCW